jgi:endonuclease YncB( thermonuclease family)
MPRDGRYSAKNQNGDADMSREGRYVAMSQGGRCDECSWKNGMSQGARMAAFLCLLCFTYLPVFADPACSAKHFSETARVRYIYDGDTVQLDDGRKVRLIGINTPELARDDKPAELFAKLSKNLLHRLLNSDKTIKLIHGVEEKDRYGRLLAHGFLTDGQNIQAELLKQGFARAISIPPNTRLSSCYFEQEHKARCSKSGLWQQNTILSAKDLEKKHIGFQLIKGEIKSITTNKKGIWLNLNDRLTVGIRPQNRPLFDIDEINDMLNQSIIVRGWLNKSNKSNPYYLRLRHPSSIQSAAMFDCGQH